MFAAARELARRGVLGINARNADYIARHNPRRAYPLVDDKLLTKELALRHAIPTPATHHVVARHGDLAGLDAAVRGLAAFAVKPARGSGGSGIVLVTGRGEGGYLRSSGKALSNEALRYHVSDILSGIHSLEGREDRAIVEALVEPDSLFAAVSYRGVPDLRIVVYRGIPVLAMVRLPTRASDGKANLHQGALGAGITIDSGVTLDAVHGNRVVDRHPDTGGKVAGIRVPHWPEILHMAARASDMTGLGYIGADIVIDRAHGPLLLELNARPGLAIQLANRRGLAHRLARVDAHPELTGKPANERVAWAMHAFAGD